MTRTAWKLLADLGHEVRTPMTGILGMSELLLDGALQPQQRCQVEAIRDAGEHLLRVLDRVLDLARVGGDGCRPDARAFDIRGLVADVAALLAPPARARGLAFRVDVAPELPSALVGDALRLRQVLFNLVGNAVKFTAHGQVAVEAAPGAGGRGLRLVVRDSGPGLDAAERSRLFRRHAQGGAGVARGGSGLGLSISHGLVLAMGGSIACESAPGGGARFVVELPLPPAHGPAADA